MTLFRQVLVWFSGALLVGCRPDIVKQSNKLAIQDTIHQRQVFSTFKGCIKLKNPIPGSMGKLHLHDTFNLFQGLDLDHGDLAAFVETSAFIDDSLGVRPGGYYYLGNDSLIKRILGGVQVIYQHGDCCTPNANLYIIRNDSQVFATGIIHGRGGGFQETVYGWTTPVDRQLIQKILRPFSYLDKLGAKETLK